MYFNGFCKILDNMFLQITSGWMFLKYMNYWKVVWSVENSKQVLNKLKSENSSSCWRCSVKETFENTILSTSLSLSLFITYIN